MMTNYEKRKDEILKLAKEKYAELYAAEAMAAHDISGMADANNVIKWLFSEYEPPLLENGDGLQPGDWIMVRDKNSDEWKKRQFLCFFEGRFCCLDYGCSLKNYDTFYTIKWRQARLPMEGE